MSISFQCCHQLSIPFHPRNTQMSCGPCLDSLSTFMRRESGSNHWKLLGSTWDNGMGVYQRKAPWLLQCALSPLQPCLPCTGPAPSILEQPCILQKPGKSPVGLKLFISFSYSLSHRYILRAITVNIQYLRLPWVGAY